MNIVHVVRQFFPAIGGFESVVFELATRQAVAGHQVRVVTLDRLFKGNMEQLPAREVVSGIEIVRVGYVGSSRYPIAPSVLKHIRGADIVNVHAIDFFFDFLAWTSPLHRRKLVVSTHGGFFHTDFAARLKRIFFATVTRLSMLAYDRVIAVSPTDEAQFKPIRPRGLVCIENGVNVSKFHSMGAQCPTKGMLWIGRFSTNKRLDRLLSFFAELNRQDPGWQLTIAGQPWDLSVEDVVDIANRLDIGDQVTVMEKPGDDEIGQAIAGAAVIASASDYEGFGIAAIEGMSAGLFPLLSNIAPFQRLVSQTGVGMNVDFAQPVAAAHAFLARWNSEISGADYAQRRDEAISAAGHYSWDQVARLYDDLYVSVTGARFRTILDVPLFVGTAEEAVARLDDAYAGAKATIVAFANAHMLNIASKDRRLAKTLQNSVVMNDGIGVDTASRILFGTRFPHNLNGTDFIPHYLRHTKNSYRIFFLGSSTGVADRAAAKLMTLSGGRHRIAGCQNGYSRSEDAAGIIAKIVASDADILLVAMGNPKQELWLADNLMTTDCRLGIGVGALFDFLSGDIPRAPLWVRNARLEWAWRLAREPSRLWRRYVVGNPVFLMRVLGQWWSGVRT